MLDIPGKAEPHSCRPSALDQWARMEAKSDAMVDEVRSGSAIDRQNATAPWVRAAVGIALGGVVLAVLVVAIIAGLIAVADGGSGDAPRDALAAPPRWGPYFP